MCPCLFTGLEQRNVQTTDRKLPRWWYVTEIQEADATGYLYTHVEWQDIVGREDVDFFSQSQETS